MANSTGTLTYEVNGTSKTISLLNEETGDMRSTFDILSDIADDWDTMALSEQQAIGIALAGKNQFEVFSSVLANFDTAIESTNTALNSSGSAAKENERYMESLAAKIANLKNAFTELVLGDGAISSFIKMVVDAGTALLKFANSDIGGFIIMATSATAVVVGLTKAFKAFKAASDISELTGLSKIFASFSKAGNSGKGLLTLISNFKTLTKEVGVAKAATQTFGGVLKGLGKIAAPLALGTVIIGILDFVDSWMHRQEELSEKAAETKSEYESIQGEISELEARSISLTESEKVRLDYLKLQSKELENQLKADYKAVSDSTLYEGGAEGLFDSDSEAAKANLKDIQNLIDNKLKLKDANQELFNEMKKNPALYEENSKQIQKNTEGVKALVDEYQEEYDALQARIDMGDTLTAEERELYDMLTLLNEAYQSMSEETVTQTMTEQEKAVTKLKTAYTGLSDNITQASGAAQQLQETLSGIDNEGDALSSYATSIEAALKDAEGTVNGTKQFWATAEAVLGKDFLESVNYNFSAVQEKLQEVSNTAEVSAEGTAAFFQMLSDNANELNEIGVKVTETAEGIDFSGLTDENLAEAAEILGVSEEYLSAMVDSAQRYADIDLWDKDALESALNDLDGYGTALSMTSDKMYLFSDQIKNMLGLTNKEWAELRPQLEEAGYGFIDLGDASLETAKALLDTNSALGEVSDGVAHINTDQFAIQLQNLGVTADEAWQYYVQWAESGDVEFDLNDVEAKRKFEEIYNTTIKTENLIEDPKNVNVQADTALNTLSSVANAIDNIPTSKTISFIVSGAKTVLDVASKVGSMAMKAEGGESEGGQTLVGEEGAELVADNKTGTAYLVGKNGAEVVMLNKGDYVYTADETKDILNGKQLSNHIKARARGSLKWSTTGKSKGSSSKKTSLTSSKSSSSLKRSSGTTVDAKKEKESTDAAIKAMEKYLVAQTELYQKGEINATKYYNNIQQKGKKYYDNGKLALEDYKDFNSDAVSEIFDEINWQYDAGNLSAQEYYDQLTKQAKRFYKNGKITYEEYRDYIKDAEDELLEYKQQKWEEELEAYKNHLQDMEDAAQARQDQANLMLDALNFYAEEQQRLIDEEIDQYNEQIEALEKQKDLIQEQNEEYERQQERLELLQALEDAKKQKIRVNLCPFMQQCILKQIGISVKG